MNRHLIKKIKFFMVAVLMLVISVFNSATTYAYSDSLIMQLNTMLSSIAMSWLESCEIEENVKVDNIINIYNTQGELTGFCIALKCNQIDYGYIVYSIKQCCITEFSIESNTMDLYEQLTANATKKYGTINENQRLYCDDNMEYFIEVDFDANKSILYSIYGNEKQFDYQISTQSNILSGWNDIIKNISDYSNSGSYSLLNENSLSNEVYISQCYVETYCQKYACAVVAMLNVCAQNEYFSYLNNWNYQLDSSKIVNAFNYLWNVSETTPIYEENDIVYGSTRNSMIASTIGSFARNYGNTEISVTTTNNPNYSVFTNAVDNDKSSVYCMQILVGDDDSEETTQSGHSVSVTGYAYYRSYATSGYVYFLKVADGWSDCARYLVFDSSNFVSSQVIVIH